MARCRRCDYSPCACGSHDYLQDACRSCGRTECTCRSNVEDRRTDEQVRRDEADRKRYSWADPWYPGP